MSYTLCCCCHWCLQSLLLLNVSLNGAAFGVDSTPSTKCPSAGPCQIDAWRQGSAFTAGKPNPSPQGDVVLRRQPWVTGVSRPEVPSATAAEITNALTDGCVADGVHDDTKALQLSIDKRAAVTFLPLGVYATSGSLVLRNGTMLFGENMAALSLKPSASGFDDPAKLTSAVLTMDVGASATVSDLTVKVLSGGSHVAGAVLVKVPAESKLHMYDVWIMVGVGVDALMRVSGGLYSSSVWGAGDGTENKLGLVIHENTHPIWLTATSWEHHIRSMVSLQGAQNVTALMTQMEEPTTQQSAAAPAPWALDIDAVSSSVHIIGLIAMSWVQQFPAIVRAQGAQDIAIFTTVEFNATQFLVAGGAAVPVPDGGLCSPFKCFTAAQA